MLLKSKDEKKHTILFIDHLGLTKVDDKRNLYEQTTEVAKELRTCALASFFGYFFLVILMSFGG